MTTTSIAIIVLVLLIELGFISISIAAASLAPWLPTKKRDVMRALRLADPKKGQIIYDLGSGTGTIVFEAAKNYPIKAIGIELAFPLYIISLIKSLFFRGIGSVEFRRKNIFKTNYSDADTVYVFGLPGPLSQKVRPKLEKDLKPGTKVVSYVFAIEGWDPLKVDWPPGKNPIYLYQIK
jgi:precorrin-6B methylase 2